MKKRNLDNYKSVDTDLQPNTFVTKMFSIRQDLRGDNTVYIQFNKKPKQIWEFQDPNAPSFSYKKIELTNLAATLT